MGKTNALHPEFVEFIPEKLQAGILYISLKYATASHSCCCGCGGEVVTPLSLTDWKLIFDGKVSLHPSIGNWGFKCQSHYWISRNKVEWAGKWSKAQIKAGYARDQLDKERYFNLAINGDNDQQKTTSTKGPSPDRESAVTKIVNWFLRR
jgi:hypothetical protein